MFVIFSVSFSSALFFIHTPENIKYYVTHRIKSSRTIAENYVSHGLRNQPTGTSYCISDGWELDVWRRRWNRYVKFFYSARANLALRFSRHRLYTRRSLLFQSIWGVEFPRCCVFLLHHTYHDWIWGLCAGSSEFFPSFFFLHILTRMECVKIFVLVYFVHRETLEIIHYSNRVSPSAACTCCSASHCSPWAST